MLWVVTRRILACNAMLSDIKLRYKRLVWINFPFFFLCRTTSFDNQRLKKKIRILFKKRGWKIWSICYKAVILHSLSREERGWALTWWETELRMNDRSKKTFWKKLRKSFGGSKIVLTFASAFAKKAIKKSSLKDLDINKQVVQ